MNEKPLQVPKTSYESVETIVEKPLRGFERIEPSSTARFLASLTATVTAVTLSSPLDVLKTRLQVQTATQAGDVVYPTLRQSFSRIWKQEGANGFFRGYKATLMTTPLFHSIYFPCYEKLRLEISKSFELEKSNMKVVAASSAMAGILWNIITNPLWLVRTRMQAEVFRVSSQAHYSRKYRSVLGSVYRIYSREGFLALYTGLGASFLGISHVWIYFPLYEKLKIHFQNLYTRSDSSSNFLTRWNISPCAIIVSSSLTAKLLTSCITYPHEVVRARQQDTRIYDKQAKSVFKVIKRIYSSEGPRAFYKGFSLNLIRMLPQNAVMFLLYENLSNFFTQSCGV